MIQFAFKNYIISIKHDESVKSAFCPIKLPDLLCGDFFGCFYQAHELLLDGNHSVMGGIEEGFRRSSTSEDRLNREG